MPTITFNNQSSTTAVAVLDPEFGESLIPTTVPKYFSSVSLTNLTNISEDKIVVNDYKIGVVVPPGNSSFEFTSSISLPTSDVIIRGAGDCSVVYQDGATTINVTPSELNRRDVISTFTNPFCFEFDGGIGALSTTQTIPSRVYNFNNAISISCWVTFGDEMFTNPNSSKNYIIVDQAGPSSNTAFSKGYCLYVTRASNNTKLLRFQVGTTTTPEPAPPTPSNQRAQINITNLRTASNQVFFILATYDSSGGGNIQLYLKSAGISQENQKVPDYDGPLDYNNQTNRFCIGNTSPNGNQGFDGKIDELGIFEKVLSSLDADNLFNWNTNGNLLSYSNANNSELRGWYRMGENATFSNPGGVGDWTLKSATDLLNTNLDLTSINIAETDVKTPGLAGQIQPPLFTNPFCFEFNGDSDSVKIAGSTNVLNMPGALSISAWVTLDPQIFNTGSSSSVTDYVIVDKADNSITEGYSLFIRKDQPSAPTAIRIRTKLGVSGNSDFQRTIQVDIQPGATNELQANTTHHIATTFDGNKIMKIYIDGVEVAEKSLVSTGTIQSTTEPFCIGNSTTIPPSAVKEYAGKIDEVSIWNIELQPSDIASIYDWNTNGDLNNFTPSGGTSANLKAWYRMGENATFDVGSGNWTLKSANDLTNADLELTSTGVAQTDIKTPGLIGPA